jgi:hypothetical protein
MSKFIKMRLAVLFFAVLVMFLYTASAGAQSSTAGSGSFTNVGYSWQVDQGATTTTFKGGATFTLTSGQVSGEQIAVNIHNSTVIHEVHGNVTLTVPGSGTNGSIIFELITDSGNSVASVKMNLIGPGSVTVPIAGTFSSPLQATSFSWRWYVDEPGNQSVNMALVMN